MTLYCTVGGSAAPILSAILRWRPARVVFVASEDDPTTRKAGSWTEVERETFDGVGPERVRHPSLVVRAGLAEGAWATLRVPADDPARVCEAIVADARAAAANRVIVDYTGGTKSMGAGAYLAANLLPNAEASLVSGPRVDHVRVTDGLQRAGTVSAGLVSRHTLDRLVRAAWERFDYPEVLRVLEELPALTAADQLVRLGALALAAWDRADYGRAAALAADCPGLLTAAQRQAVARLARSDVGAWLATDLYWMAARRARAGRHDDEVLLLYRCTEYTAQWLLRRDHGVDAGNVVERPELVDLCGTARDGRRVLGQVAAWRALARLGGPAAAAAEGLAPGLLNFVDFRNNSLYAHGLRPVSPEDAARAREWFDQRVRPLFAGPGGALLFGQLPTDPPR